jgi:type VI secretion system ImpM family protein
VTPFWRKEEAPGGGGGSVGFYGKLPQFGDFVQQRATGEPLAKLEEWIQVGLAALRDADGPLAEDYDEGPPVQFLHPAGLAGAMRPSRDASGRRYPFVVFFPWRPGVDAWLGPLRCARALGDAEAAAEDAPRASDLEAIAALLKQIAPAEQRDARANYGRFLGAARAAALGGTLEDKLARLADACTPIRKAGTTSAGLTLRFPLANAEPHASACFWLDVLLRLLCWNAAPLALLAATADRPYLLVPLGKPSAKTFLHLFRDDVADEALCDLTENTVDSGPGPLLAELLHATAETARR